MNTDPKIPILTETTSNPCLNRLFPTICWKAIIAGTVAAIGIHILLTALGIGAGLATFSPRTDENPAGHIATGSALIWSVCALVSLWFGGLIAGRFSHSIHGGFVHGILVWSVTLIITLLLLSMGTGMVLGGALKAAGLGLGIGGSAAVSGEAAGAKQSSNQLGSFIDEAVQSVPTNAAPKASTRARREVGFAVTKLFAPGNDINSPDNRSALIKALVDTTQMSQADATQTVDDWTASYKNLKAELEQKAEVAARNLSCAATWSFFALLIGLVLTGCAGALGARCAVRHARMRTEVMA